MIQEGENFCLTVHHLFEQYKSLSEKAAKQLTDQEWNHQASPSDNSVAMIMHHMGGNLQSRFINFYTSDGEKPWRNRDSEFVDEWRDRKKIYQLWEEGWAALFQITTNLTTPDLLKTVTIRGEHHTVLQAILRQLAHHSYHCGQIVYLAKLLKGNNFAQLSIAKGESQAFNQSFSNGAR
ncbi:MAG: hypothetical protein RIQ89_2189 [Bacteroidota bacterium]|jgi:hypothetical protein